MSQNSTSDLQINKVLWIVSIALLFHVVLSYNLWFPISRTYPEVPFFKSIPLSFGGGRIGTSVLSTLFLLGFVLGSFFESIRKQSYLLGFACFALLLLEDFNRLQVWLYIYLAIMGSVLWFYKSPHLPSLKSSLQFIIALVYCWTGVQKLNPQFTLDVYTWLVGILDLTRPLKTYPSLGYGIGLFELFIGSSFFFRKTQNLAVILTTVLHSGILVLLICDNYWNTIVYPWNVSMIGLVWILFWKQEESIITPSKRPNLVILGLFGILPILDFGNYWVHELSFGMYSGVAIEGDLYFEDGAEANCVPTILDSKLLYQSETESALSLDDWGMQNLNIPPISTVGSFEHTAKIFCQCLLENDASGGIEFTIPYRWQDKDTVYKIPCEVLLQEDTKN